MVDKCESVKLCISEFLNKYYRAFNTLLSHFVLQQLYNKNKNKIIVFPHLAPLNTL